MRVASIDIGKKNFAFVVEEFDETDAASGKVIEAVRVELDGGKETVRSHSITIDTVRSLTSVLDSHSCILETCTVFLIEQHMSRNTFAVKLAQHCVSYFSIRYPPIPGAPREIVVFPAYYKTKTLGAPKVENKRGRMVAMSKPQRKKWSVQRAKAEAERKEDAVLLDALSNNKKKDDIADCFNQLQAFKIERFDNKRKFNEI